MNIAIDATTKRLILAQNNLVFLTGIAAVKQAWRFKMRTFVNPPWILQAGIPAGWLDFNDRNGPFAAQPNMAALSANIRKQTLAVPGILSVQEVSIVTDRHAIPPQRSLFVAAIGTDGPLDLRTLINL